MFQTTNQINIWRNPNLSCCFFCTASPSWSRPWPIFVVKFQSLPVSPRFISWDVHSKCPKWYAILSPFYPHTIGYYGSSSSVIHIIQSYIAMRQWFWLVISLLVIIDYYSWYCTGCPMILPFMIAIDDLSYIDKSLLMISIDHYIPLCSDCRVKLSMIIHNVPTTVADVTMKYPIWWSITIFVSYIIWSYLLFYVSI